MVPGRVKPALRSAFWTYRQATWRSRALPDFIIIGAQKCGTTSLFSYLSGHPKLLPSFSKEVHYFDGGLDPAADNFKKGEAWYRAHFPLEELVTAQKRTFEASPFYIYHPLVARRIADLLPQVKLVAVLRNPTERALSHYFHARRGNLEPLPVLEAMQQEERRLEPLVERGDFKNVAFRIHSYKSRGLYSDQIARYLACFPRSRLLALSSEAFFNEPKDTLRRVFEFVGVDADFTPAKLKALNVSWNRREVDPEVHAYLNDFFRPHNRALFDMIGEDFGW
jgi:hypothetical protein